MPNSGGAFGSAILEVGIGLFFVYFLLSTVSSTIQELLAGWLKLRAQDLERGIANLLCAPDIVQGVLDHPLITAIGNSGAENVLVRSFARRDASGRPSYIPSSTFALAMMDHLAPASEAPMTVGRIRARAFEFVRDPLADLELLKTRAQQLPSNQRAVSDRLVKLLSESPRDLGSIRAAVQKLPPGSEIAQILDADARAKLGRALLLLTDEVQMPRSAAGTLDALRSAIQTQVEQKGTPDDEILPLHNALQVSATLDQMRQAVTSNIKDERLQAIALAPINAVEVEIGRLDVARKNIEDWYDKAMQHVSGVYKRRTQTWLLVIAMLVAVVSGGDTLRMVRTLFQSPELRNAIVQEAVAVAASPGVLSPATPTPVPASGSTVAPAASAASPTPGPGATATPTQLQRIAQEMDVGLPLFGYTDERLLLFDPNWWTGAKTPDQVTRFAWKLLGLAVTAVAVSLGAPFWFDMLQKVVNVKSAGARPRPDVEN